MPKSELVKLIRRSEKLGAAHLEEARHAIDDKGRGTMEDLLDAIHALELARTHIIRAVTLSVRVTHDAGASWAAIAAQLEPPTTRQNAQQRFGSVLVDRKLPGA